MHLPLYREHYNKILPFSAQLQLIFLCDGAWDILLMNQYDSQMSLRQLTYWIHFN